MRSSAKTKASTPLHQIIHPSPTLNTALQFGIIFTPILFTKGGESLPQGLISHSQVSVFGDHAKGEESISPKQKDRTTTNFKNVVLQICIQRKFFYWYLIFDRIFKLV
jgi:hypothetical protein